VERKNQPITTEQILAFIAEFFAWAQETPNRQEREEQETCNIDWDCCPYHRQALQEYEQFCQLGKIIEDQFPMFHEDGNGKADYYPGITSQGWFLQLSKVSGISLPQPYPPSWENVVLGTDSVISRGYAAQMKTLLASLDESGARELAAMELASHGHPDAPSWAINDWLETYGNVHPETNKK